MRTPRFLAALLLLAMPLVAGCGGSGASAPSSTATAGPDVGLPTSTPVPGAVGDTPIAASPTMVSGACTPSLTDGNGGPYPAPTSSDCTGSRLVDVDIEADPKIIGGFRPSNITIRIGTTVKWVWKASGHNVAPFHNGIEAAGFSFSKTFSTSGDYPYMCQIHTGQIGIVHVVRT